MTLIDQKLDTMPSGRPHTALGVAADGTPALFKTWVILAQSSVAISAPADTNENVLTTVVIPAGTMGLNGRIRITSLWSVTNSANNKTIRHRFGGSSYHAITVTTQASYRAQAELGNRNSASSQVGGTQAAGGWSATTSAVVTSSIDTTVDVDFTFTGTKANAGETLRLESYLIELVYAE